MLLFCKMLRMKKENHYFYSNKVLISRRHELAGASSLLSMISQILSVILLRPQAQQ